MNKFSTVLRSLLRQPVSRQALPLKTAARYAPIAIRTFHNTIPRPNTLGQPHLLPEFSLKDKVIVVSGGARGLGLVWIEALLEASATSRALYYRINSMTIAEFNNSCH
jgi:hypothetical protein